MPDYFGSAGLAADPARLTQQTIDFDNARLRDLPSVFTSTTILALNDRLFIGRIPSNARLVDVGKIVYSAFGGSAALNIGFLHSKMTSAERTAAANKLWAAQSIAAAGNRQVMAGVAIGDLAKRVWQLAGMTADPGGDMEVIATVTAAAAANGTLHADITYITD